MGEKFEYDDVKDLWNRITVQWEENGRLPANYHGIPPARFFNPNDVEREAMKDSKVPFNTKDIPPKAITPRKMWTTKGGYTTVEWMDGTKTTVKAENEETATEFGGFTAALAKKIFRTTANVNREIEKAKELADKPARERENRRAAMKARKQAAHQKRIYEREKRIREMMEEMKLRDIARERLDREETET